MRRGRPRKYLWEEWFSARRTVLQRGVDYRCSQSAMINQIRNRASRCGVHVSLTDGDDTIVIEVIGDGTRGELPVGCH